MLREYLTYVSCLTVWTTSTSFIILLCKLSDDFTHEGVSVPTDCFAKKSIYSIPLMQYDSINADSPHFIILLCLSSDFNCQAKSNDATQLLYQTIYHYAFL